MVAGRGRLLLAATAAILLCQACGQARANLSSGWPSGQFCPDDDSLAYRCNAPGEGCNLVDCQPDHRCLEVVCNGTCLPRCFKTPGAGGVNLCPDGKPPNTCFVDPCSLARCPSGTVCSSNYCTRGATACTATCKKAGTVCPDGQPLAYCFIDPCHPSIAPKCTAGQVCYRNYCGGCTAFCAMPDSKVCPDGNPPDNCLIDPCSTNPCEPGDTCRPDYCSRNPACKAICTKPPAHLCPYSAKTPMRRCPASTKGGVKRRCPRQHTTAPSNPCNCKQPSKCVKACSDGQPPTPCLLDPCSPLVSPCQPGEQCTADYCSDEPCKAKCTKADTGGCRNGPSAVRCKRNPCDDPSACPKGELCTPDYCAGCRAVCTAPGMCPPGAPVVNCFVDPCQVTTCPVGTKCESNYCGGCHALCIRSQDTCPPSAPEVSCVLNPCKQSLKPCGEGQVCTVNRCGQCSAVCSDASDGEIPAVDFTQCVGDGPVQCLVNPCDTGNKCPTDRQCVPEYCGGCGYDCLSRVPCASGFPRRACVGTANRCMLAKCGFNATCVPDQCNNCAATCVKPCDAGYYINKDSPNGPECSKCKAGYKCPAGAPTPDPVPCNGGYYQDAEGRTSCKRCTGGTTTPKEPSYRGYTSCFLSG